MTKHVQCPHCGQAYALTEEQVPRYAGQEIACSQCGESFLVSQDIAMTGGLATEPTTFQTRPEATAAAFPSPYAPGATFGFGGLGGAMASAASAASTASVPAPVTPTRPQPFEYPTIPSFASQSQRPFYGAHVYPREGETNGWALASIVFAVIGFIVPVVPGLLAIVFGLIGLRRLRETNSGAGLALGGIVVGVMSMMFSGGVFYNYVWPRIEMVRSGAGHVRCTDNLATIGKSMRQYASANGGNFPDKLESIVADGTLKADALVCAASGDSVAPGATPRERAANLRSGSHVSYVYVGQNLTTSSPAECVLMYEAPGRHGDGMNVLFIDGRVQAIGDVEAGKAITRLSRGVNPPWTSSGK